MLFRSIYRTNAVSNFRRTFNPHFSGMEFMMSQIEIVLNGQKKLIEKSLTIAELVAEN